MQINGQSIMDTYASHPGLRKRSGLHGGVVTLEGKVDDPKLIAGITATAERLKGVISIDNKTTVASVKKDLGAKGAPSTTPEKKAETTHGSTGGGPVCG